MVFDHIHHPLPYVCFYSLFSPFYHFWAIFINKKYFYPKGTSINDVAPRGEGGGGGHKADERRRKLVPVFGKNDVVFGPPQMAESR